MDFAAMTSGRAAIALEGYSAARRGETYDAGQCQDWRNGWTLWHCGPYDASMTRASAPRVYGYHNDNDAKYIDLTRESR